VNDGVAGTGTAGWGSTGCLNDSDCSAQGLVCHEPTRNCVACVLDADCSGEAICEQFTCVPFTGCRDDLDCAEETDARNICDVDRGQCVQCLFGSDCSGDDVCVSGSCRTPCDSDNDCTGLGLLCDFATGYCMDPGAPAAGSGGSGGGAGTSGNGGASGGAGYDGGLACQLDIYVMLDDSGSMVPWWPQVMDALATFMTDPASEGIGMGIQYFGPDTPCDAEQYATPAVPIAPLPGNTSAIQASIPILPVESSTPTLPALQGAIDYARSWSDSHPESTVVVWLVTDGLPEGCESTVENVAAAARDGLNNAPSIPTYVIGIGDLTALDQIAEAGGTGTAVIAEPGSSQQLVQAMNALRDSASNCDL
jgi:hypothetical protein